MISLRQVQVLAIESHQQYPRSPAPQQKAPDTTSGDAASPLTKDRSPGLADRAAEGLSRTASGNSTSHRSSKVIALGSNAVSAERNGAGKASRPALLPLWQGEVAVVTGATSAVGLAVCEALLAAGMRVVGAAPQKKSLQELQAGLLEGGVPGDMFLPVVCDVAREDEVRALMAIAVKTFAGRPVAVLVAAAAERPAAGGQVLGGAHAAWAAMMTSNVLATATSCREACESMRRAEKWGHLILVRGAAGGAEGLDTIYGATQAALHSLAAGLRREARQARVPLRVTLVTAAGLASAGAAPPSARSGDGPAELTPKEVAGAIVSVLGQPAHVDVSEISVQRVDHES